MNKEELIQKIVETVKDGSEVVIFDSVKNFAGDDGEGSSAGIYKNFEIVNFGKKDIMEGSNPFSAICFTSNEDKWIPVNDRLPSKGERIIVFAEEFGVSSRILHLSSSGSYVDSESYTIPSLQKFTHWMPLPEPPKEQSR